MLAQPTETRRISQFKHNGTAIVELTLPRLSFDESLTLIREFADWLDTLRAGRQVKLLLDVSDYNYDPRVILAWKSQLGIFNTRIEKSAVYGASALATAAVNGIAKTASLVGYSFKGRRGMLFETREEALEFLAQR